MVDRDHSTPIEQRPIITTGVDPNIKEQPISFTYASRLVDLDGNPIGIETNAMERILRALRSTTRTSRT